MKQNNTLRTPFLLLSAILLTVTSSSPVPAQSDVTSYDDWLLTSEGGRKSHLVMWMMTRKQLIPRVEGLVHTATGLLRCTCRVEGKEGVDECLAFAQSLPDIPGLSDVPSQTVLHQENKKSFVKTLLENAYVSLRELERLLRSQVTAEGLTGCQGGGRAEHFMDSLQTATTQLKNLMTSHYNSQITDLRPHPVPQGVFSSERQHTLKVLHQVVHHLNQVSGALEYSVQLSWFTRLEGAAGIKGKRRRTGRRSKTGRKTRKTG